MSIYLRPFIHTPNPFGLSLFTRIYGLEMAVHKVWCMYKRTEVTIFDKSENSLFQTKLHEQVLTTMAKTD